jgi:hypothetical protein
LKTPLEKVGFLFLKVFIIKLTNMKKILFTLVTLFTIVILSSCKNEKVQPIAKEKVLTLYYGKFAFCGASPATPTGNEIVVEGKTFKAFISHKESDKGTFNTLEKVYLKKNK